MMATSLAAQLSAIAANSENSLNRSKVENDPTSTISLTFRASLRDSRMVKSVNTTNAPGTSTIVTRSEHGIGLTVIQSRDVMIAASIAALLMVRNGLLEV